MLTFMNQITDKEDWVNKVNLFRRNENLNDH
jgi:hypothetical protein